VQSTYVYKRERTKATKQRSFSYALPVLKGRFHDSMIRHFTNLCKAILKKLNDGAIFEDATNRFQCRDKKCPNCGATGKLFPYGDYSRGFVFLKDEKTVSGRISPLRFKCESCKTTHALLPDIIIPHSPYSLAFKLTVLVAYFERDNNVTVTTVCERFCIAVSTLYEWKKRLVVHKELLLGVLAGKKVAALDFLRGLITSDGISEVLNGFFRRYAFSFLQERSAVATQCHPP